MDNSISTPDEVHRSEDSLVDPPVVHNKPPLPLHTMLSKGFRCKGRAGPFTISSNQLTRDNFCLELFVNPFCFLTFEAMGRSATRRSCRYRVMQKIPERGARSTFNPESTSLSPNHFSTGFHISLRETRSDAFSAKAKTVENLRAILRGTARVFLDFDTTVAVDGEVGDDAFPILCLGLCRPIGIRYLAVLFMSCVLLASFGLGFSTAGDIFIVTRRLLFFFRVSMSNFVELIHDFHRFLLCASGQPCARLA